MCCTFFYSCHTPVPCNGKMFFSLYLRGLWDMICCKSAYVCDKLWDCSHQFWCFSILWEHHSYRWSYAVFCARAMTEKQTSALFLISFAYSFLRVFFVSFWLGFVFSIRWISVWIIRFWNIILGQGIACNTCHSINQFNYIIKVNILDKG